MLASFSCPIPVSVIFWPFESLRFAYIRVPAQLTRLDEGDRKKCERYWPEGTAPEKHGDYVVYVFCVLRCREGECCVRGVRGHFSIILLLHLPRILAESDVIFCTDG